MHVFAGLTGYHDVSIGFPFVTSTVQGGEAHGNPVQAGVVYTGNAGNRHRRKISYTRHLQNTHKEGQRDDRNM